MTNVNDEIWVTANDDKTATIMTGKSALAGVKKVAALPDTIKSMATRIAKRNGGSPTFPTETDAEAALVAEEIAVLAGLRS